MDSVSIIKDQADVFSREIRGYEARYDGDKQFKSDLEDELYNFYEDVDKLIYLYQVKNNLEIEIQNHQGHCRAKESTTCSIELKLNKMLFFLEQEIRSLNPEHDFTILRPSINSSIIKENLTALDKYPEAATIYLSAIDKLNQGKFERNLLDDLRLSIEILIKNILGNQKSLENQFSELGIYLDDKSITAEIRNMFVKLLDYYSKYHNNYIKHNDIIHKSELELVVNLSSSFINFLINL